MQRSTDMRPRRLPSIMMRMSLLIGAYAPAFALPAGSLGLSGDATGSNGRRAPTAVLRLVNPHGAAGARAIVARYASLLGQHRFREAALLWGRGIKPQFATLLASSRHLAGSVGKPFDEEGAAGSIFIRVPLKLTGLAASGRPFTLAGDLTLRRVNGVPGATRAQLDWHIVASNHSRTG